MTAMEHLHGQDFTATTPAERSQSHVGRNDWRLMAALLRKVGYGVTEPDAAQDGWRDMQTAPRCQRVLVCYACGVIEIARQSSHADGWAWVSDDGERQDGHDDPIVAWMPLPPSALPRRPACRCGCHLPGGRQHPLPCCRDSHAGAAGSTGFGTHSSGPGGLDMQPGANRHV